MSGRAALWMVALVVVVAPRVGAGQFFDPDTRVWAVDKGYHAAAGASIAVLASGPWIARDYRNTALKRMAWAAVVCAVYEGVQAAEAAREGRRGPGYGFGTLDLGACVTGAAVVEGVRWVLW